MTSRFEIPNHHECDEATCGIFYDPACPIWSEDGALPWSPQTVSEFAATLQSPTYRKRLTKVLLELLAPEIGRIVAGLDREGK